MTRARAVVAAALLVLTLTGAGCQNTEREEARRACESPPPPGQPGTFVDSQADDGTDVWSCVL